MLSKVFYNVFLFQILFERIIIVFYICILYILLYNYENNNDMDSRRQPIRGMINLKRSDEFQNSVIGNTKVKNSCVGNTTKKIRKEYSDLPTLVDASWTRWDQSNPIQLKKKESEVTNIQKFPPQHSIGLQIVIHLIRPIVNYCWNCNSLDPLVAPANEQH